MLRNIVERWGAVWRRLDLAAAVEVDYFLWYCFFVYLSCLAWASLRWLEGVAINYRIVIWVAGVANGGFLVLALAMLDGLIQRAACRWLRYLWGGCVGLIAAGFYADVLLFRMMAIHLPTGLRLLLESGPTQFLLTVQATGVGPTHLKTFGLFAAGAFVSGALARSMTRCVSNRAPVLVRPLHALAAIAVIVLVLTGWEWSWEGDNPHEKAWEEVHRVLPFAMDLLHNVRGQRLEVGRLRPPRSGPSQGVKQVSAFVEGHRAGAASEDEDVPHSLAVVPSLPDIFVFVLESTRRDYLTPVVAPNLARFAQDCVGFRDSVSSGNATHVSWFSLLTANQPLCFAIVSKRPELWGSMPLRLLRGAGYQVRVFASAFLAYHNVDRIVFGQNLELANSIVDAQALGGFEDRPSRDREVTRRLIEEIPKQRGGRMFLVFYDSSHHDYYWPDDFPAKFKPSAQSWQYFRFNISSNQLTGIKNRYRNALNFVDSLFGSVMDELKKTGTYDDALIFATGDHGEEFLEHGKLVHASELWREQIDVPFFLKLPRGMHPDGLHGAASLAASHLDFLPTLLDCLAIETRNLFDGQSLFRKKADFALTADDNGARDPYRFCVISGDRKAWFQYRSDSTLIALEKTIWLTKVTDRFDNEVPGASGQQEAREVLSEMMSRGLARFYPDWKDGPQPAEIGMRSEQVVRGREK